MFKLSKQSISISVNYFTRINKSCQLFSSTISTMNDNDTVIISVKRTPIGSFGGALSALSATKLGSIAIEAAVSEAGIQADQVGEVIMGNVISAGLGQAPARQAALGAGLPFTVPCTTINKVCASGMKAVMLASMSLTAGQHDIIVAGGMESMSNAPYYLDKARFGGYKYGNVSMLDGLIRDGLWDVYNDHHMGMCAEDCASKYSITREEQDAFTLESYKRAAAAWAQGDFDDEIIKLNVPNPNPRGSNIILEEDEEYKAIKYDKVPKLKPAFTKDGTVTAANASTLNDGAAALVLTTMGKARAMGVTPLARIRGFGDAARAPIEFTIAPSDAVPIALKNAGVSAADIDYHEINEAFSVVALANMRILNLDPSRVNVNGGAVAIGHPIGVSGARIIGTLLNILKQKDASLGCASICNGGGGASAIVIERLS